MRVQRQELVRFVDRVGCGIVLVLINKWGYKMNVLVFKAPKSVEMVPDHRGYLEMRRYGSERKHYVDLDPVAPMLLDTVKLEHWPIRKFSKYHCDPSERGMPIERQNRQQIDTYIAVDPELEKFLAIEYNQKIDEAYRLLNAEKTSRMQREIQIDNWWSMPWYKRAFSSIFKKQSRPPHQQ